MRTRRLLLPLLFIFLSFNTSLFSQTKGGKSSLFNKVFSGDSLAGFDEEAVKLAGIAEGLYGDNFKTLLEIKKRAFIDSKYGLDEQSFNNFGIPNTNIGGYSLKPIGGSNFINNAPCNNEDFEIGNLTGWAARSGTNSGSQIYPLTPTVITMGSQVTVVSTPLIDPATSYTIPNSPLGGTKVVKINNTAALWSVVKISQTFSVTPTNYLYDFAYWAVMQDAANHDCANTPYMLVKIRNFTGTLQACPNFSIVAPSSGAGGCAGIGPSTWTTVAGSIKTNNSWQKFSIDLTAYMNSDVTVEVIVAACGFGGHYGYAYFDSNCNTMNLTVNGTQTLSMPTTTVTPQVLCGTTATLTAPSGLGPYSWTGPPGSGITSNTNQTIATPVAGNYTLNMSPSGICNPPISKIVKLSFAPPTTVVATPTAICAAGSNTSAVLTASGATSYTWQPGNLVGSTFTVSPATTTIYTLTAVTGTCIGVYTTQVVVNANPNVSISNSSPSVCVAGSATLLAIGASTYSWSTGSILNPITVAPVTATIYSVTGTSTAGCVGTATTNVSVNGVPSPTLFNISVPSTICVGGAVSLVAAGPYTFTWLPAGATGAVVSLSPSVTTVYTVIAAAGSCTNTANITVTVDPGPTMTVSSTPTIICPGNTATLSSIAPTATGFTWTPGGANTSSITVSPITTTNYSVTGVNSNGCRSTYTIDQVVSPVPSITISPVSPSLCIGTSLTLTASGGSTYTWNPGNILLASAVISPTNTTTYTVVASNGVCTSSLTTNVVVVPIPTVNATASPTAICNGASTNLSAIGAGTYTWLPGSLTGGNVSVSPTISTTYTVTGNSGGCSNNATVAVVVNPLPLIGVAASPTAVCPGFCSTLIPSGASSYTYSSGTPFVCPTVTTTYSVSGTSSLGCVSSGTVAILVNPTPSIGLSASSSSVCFGSSATFTATGASSYTWNPGNLTGANVTLSPTVTTTYTVAGLSAAGCLGQNTITLFVVPTPTVSASTTTNVLCAGSCATLSAIGATNYTWTPGNLFGPSATVCPTITTTYTLQGNSGGCIGSSVIIVTVNALPIINATASPTSICLGNSAVLSANGAISYTWLPVGLNGSTISVNPLVTTTYSVTGLNASGCSATKTVQLVVNPLPSISISAGATTICAGSSTSLSAFGASSYTWNPTGFVGSTILVTPSVTTTYTVSGTSSFGCVGQNTITITVIPSPTIVISSSPASTVCAGFPTTLTATGAANYTWTPGSLTGSQVIVSPTVTTVYSVFGSSGGCTASAFYTLTVVGNPIIFAIANPTSICSGITASLTAGGGAGNSYTWQPGALTGSLVNVNPSTTTLYTVTGSNVSGCLGTTTLNLVVNAAPTITVSTSAASVCAGSNATLTASGANTYTWNPGNIPFSNALVSPTVTTTYTVNGTSLFGCTSQTTITIFVTPSPTILITATSTLICSGGCATLTANGASNYTWMPGGFTGSTIAVCPLVPTLYTATGNSGGCSGSAFVPIIVNIPPTITASISPGSICAGGSATLSAGGGSTYTWQPGNLTGSTVTVSPLATTLYTVTGTNLSGCASSTIVNLVVNPVPTVSISPTSFSICLGGFVTLTANGANSYTWNPTGTFGSTVLANPTITTVYTVNGSSAFGCFGQSSATVFVVPVPTLSLSAIPAAVCAGGCSTLSALGAINYTWLPSGTVSPSVAVCPSVTTTYSVIGSSGNCTGTSSITINVNSIPSLTITSSSNTICAGSSATLNGLGTLTYTWNPTLSTNSTIVVSPTTTTVYSLTGSNGLGCSNATTFTLTVVPIPTLSAVASSPSVCAGFTTALTATGATSYTWNPSGATGSLTVETPSITTTYTLIGESGGCSSSTTLTISVVPLPIVTATANPANVCLGFSTTLGANGALTYTWLPGFNIGATFTDTPLTTTTYTVVGLAASGCPNFATVTVNVLPTPTVGAISTSTGVCIGNSATLTANGAASYTWEPGSLTSTIIVVNPAVSTIYTLTGDNGGCTNSTTISLVVNPLPTINPSISNTLVCSGTSVSLSALGASNYTWNPIGAIGASVIDNPTISLTYTVIGEDVNGCINQANISVSVNPAPLLIATATPTSMCQGSTVTLSSSGALSFTWSPTGLTSGTITDTPNTTTTYTVSGIDAIGCIGSQTVQVTVIPNPTLSVSPLNPSICAGTSATLTAGGATNYTWLPSGTNSSVTIENPLVTTNYTVIGDNGGICFATFTVDVFVNPVPANLVATSSGTITCASPTVALTGSSTSSNVSYNWTGPSSYSSNLQNPTVTIWGDYTLTVTYTNTGCSATISINVPTDNSIPSVTATTSGSITCAATSVTLIAASNTTANPGYLWNGPSGFTSTAASFTTSLFGVFTVTVSDLSSGCTGTALVTVGIHTNVPITATIIPATCTGTASNNNGTILVSNFGILDKYDLVSGLTYTGAVTYTNASIIPSNSIITSNLANPTTTLAYTIRFYDSEGCTKDTTLVLVPTDCSLKTLGIAKAVSTPTLNNDGTYDIEYKVVVKNFDTAPLSNVLVTENLAITFPAPTTFSLIAPPVITTSGSSLTLNSGFDGVSQTNITTVLTSTLPIGKTDTLAFTVRLTPNGFFGPFNNKIIGLATSSSSVILRDTSTTGLNPDPDADLNPGNNSIPTTLTLTPNLFFGITKIGEVSAKQDDNSFNVSYSITVHNLGNDTLYNVVLKDSLFETTIKQPATYSIKSGPIASGSLTANPLFDGKNDANLLIPSLSKMPPGFVNTVSFIINVNPDTVSVIKNSAYGSSIGSKGRVVSDTSNAGNNPDSNGNGVWNEPADNVPTVLTISSHTLFIPEGFTPNGDNKNDLFVIKGLPASGQNSFTIFNRWGNKVYSNNNYDNTWDGHPNVGGAIGNNKLPQGTYFFILDMKGSGVKPITGFIVLQY